MIKKVAILTNKSNTFGLRRDCEILQEALKGKGYIFQVYDFLEPCSACDIAIHLEIPSHVWIPWAATNILVVNPEWYISAEWDAYLPKFDALFCKDTLTHRFFSNKLNALNATGATKVYTTGWAVPPTNTKISENAVNEFVWFCAASKNKAAMIPTLLKAWDASFPKLHIYKTADAAEAADTADLENAVPSNVVFHIQDLSPKERETIACSYKGHLAFSSAEGFGYTAAEAESLGAFMILNTLPVYTDLYNNNTAHFVDTSFEMKDMGAYVDVNKLSVESVRNQLRTHMEYFLNDSHTHSTQEVVGKKWNNFCNTLSETLTQLHADKKKPNPPPVIEPKDCPMISIVTLVYNRPKFIKNAQLNLLLSDYPREKIEWVIVDDSDPEKGASDQIMQFEKTFAPGRIVYVPLAKRSSIGRKRNLGIKRATADILLMMDDDDHYPITSLRRRVGWLIGDRDPHECATCTTIAMYDLCQGKSAVNVPPMTLGLAKRCSEATLTFTRDFWKARPFDEKVTQSEGEAFLAGRESAVVEMPPQQIIVAFSHGTNASGRNLPDKSGSGCFWGFDKSYLQFIHGLVDVIVEEEKT